MKQWQPRPAAAMSLRTTSRASARQTAPAPTTSAPPRRPLARSRSSPAGHPFRPPPRPRGTGYAVVTAPRHVWPAPTDEWGEVISRRTGRSFFLTLMSESIDGSKAFVAGSVLSLVAWSVLCALFSGWLAELANDDVGWAESWLEDMQACNSAIGVLGEGRRKAADMEETLACASNTLICRLVATPRYLRNVVRVYLGFQVQSGEDTT